MTHRRRRIGLKTAWITREQNKNKYLTVRMFACMHARMAAIKHNTNALTHIRSSGGEKEPLQVRIPTSVKRAFKSHAALRGIEPNALFVEVWEHYERTKPAATGEK